MGVPDIGLEPGGKEVSGRGGLGNPDAPYSGELMGLGMLKDLAGTHTQSPLQNSSTPSHWLMPKKADFLLAPWAAL